MIDAGAGGACAAVLSVGWVCVGVSERLRRAVCGCRVSDQPRWYWAHNLRKCVQTQDGRKEKR